jgi:hypothetical protein
MTEVTESVNKAEDAAPIVPQLSKDARATIAGVAALAVEEVKAGHIADVISAVLGSCDGDYLPHIKTFSYCPDVPLDEFFAVVTNDGREFIVTFELYEDYWARRERELTASQTTPAE